MLIRPILFGLLCTGVLLHFAGKRRVATPAAAANPAWAAEMPADAAASPNPAERLQASHALGVGAGIGQALPGEAQDGPLFDSNRPRSAQSAKDEVIVPGLPDMFRGA